MATARALIGLVLLLPFVVLDFVVLVALGPWKGTTSGR